MNNLDKLEEEIEEERWLGCERLLYILGLVLGILWFFGISFLISVLK